MRKLIPILLIPFLAAGCYEEIRIPTEDKDPVLVMNAQMNNLEETHVVNLSVSRLSKVEPLPGATVKVYVNGVLVAEAVERAEKDAWNRPLMRLKRNSILGTKCAWKPRKAPSMRLPRPSFRPQSLSHP